MSPRPVHVVITGTALPGLACGPYTEVHVALQVGKAHVGLVPGDAPRAAWETTIQLAQGDAWTFKGPAVHGPRGQRFFYLAWVGRLDGAEPALFRRAKLLLDGIPAPLLTEAWESGVLHATLGLTDRCGMPLCAAIRPPVIGWEAGRVG